MCVYVKMWVFYELSHTGKRIARVFSTVGTGMMLLTIKPTTQRCMKTDKCPTRVSCDGNFVNQVSRNCFHPVFFRPICHNRKKTAKTLPSISVSRRPKFSQGGTVLTQTTRSSRSLRNERCQTNSHSPHQQPFRCLLLGLPKERSQNFLKCPLLRAC